MWFKHEKERSDSFRAWNSLTLPLQVDFIVQEMHWATDEPHSCCCLQLACDACYAQLKPLPRHPENQAVLGL